MNNTGQFLSPGQMFGDYEVVRELGRGGMGAVYLVRDPFDGAEFAVKVMFPTVNDSMSVRRFIREAEIAMTVEHPNLVHVHEVGRDPDTGLGYMVMDYAGGGSLRDLLLRRLASGEGPLSPREAISILRPVASALAAAEARGVVHRDIKPDNILFTSAGVPLLADLGVAKKSAGEDDSTLLTMSDVIVGTPAYMAPEQMTNSHAVDSRADVYSLGLVLWEMLVGERPTAGASAAELMARAIRGERISDITTRLPRTPRLIVELVRGMTEPMPEKRIPGPAAVLEFVDEWRSRERRRFKTWLAAVIVFSVLVLSAVLAGGIWYVRRELSASREGSAAPSPSRVNDLSADDVGDAVDSVFGNP